MEPFKNILDLIRNFFTPLETTRKRRGSNIDVINHKVGRYSPYNSKVRIIPIQRETYDSPTWFAGKAETYKKSPQLKAFRTPMKPLSIEDTINLDDDDDIAQIRKPRFKIERRGNLKSFTSTPENIRTYRNGNIHENGDNDVILVKATKSPKERKEEAKLAGFSYIKPKTSLSEKPLFNIGVANPQNNSRLKGKVKRYSLKSPTNGTQGLSSLDYSYRLDDKLHYKKLLAESANSLQNSSLYQTPTGKIFESYNMGNSCGKKSKSPLYGKDKLHDKPTVKETIMRVIESEPVVIRDSDSEDSVVLVNPPSPKPDIKVDPINSLKKIVDTSKVSKKDWLDDIVEKHKQNVEERQREINNLRQCSLKSEEINKDINIELLRRKVNDCLQLKDIILPEIVSEPETELPPLTVDHHRMVQRAFKGSPNEILARKFNLNITRRDLMTLAGLNWLNDEVINFYMNLIIERGKESRWPKTYAFNTFFYTKLLKDGPQSLRRWTKKIDLFDHDLVCVPIHLGMHWCMAVIDFRDNSIRYYDSMGSPNNRCLEALKNYLEVEHNDKKGTQLETNNFILENMDDIPQQMNGSDCGMFACTFVEFISRNAKITFKQEDMPYFRKKMVVEIMLGELLIQ